MKEQKWLLTGSRNYGEEISDVVAGIQMSVIFIVTSKLDYKNRDNAEYLFRKIQLYKYE